jgi:hypothetical protein
MRGRPCWMRSPYERNGLVPRCTNDQGQMSFCQIVLRCRTLVHGTWYVAALVSFVGPLY